MKSFTADSGQSIYDVCLNTYAGLDNIVKLMQDNNVENLNAIIKGGDAFEFDETLVQDQTTTQVNKFGNVKYVTSQRNNGGFGSVVEGPGNDQPTTPPDYYQPPTDTEMSKYQLVEEGQYTAGADGENTFAFPGRIGWHLIQVEKEIKPLKTSEYSWNPNSGTLTIPGGVYSGDTLFMLFGKIIIEEL